MIQRLNLIPPDPKPEAERRTADIPFTAFDPALKPDPQTVQVVRNMAKELAAGQTPEWLYLCGLSDGILTFHASAEDKRVVLLFTTPLAAIDYIQETKTGDQIHQVNFEAVPDLAQKLLAAGIGGIALNRCPRCPVTLYVPLEEAANRETFLMFWAVRRATQLYFGQRTVRQFLAAKDTVARIAALELIRDYIDCSIPYLFELLAFFARTEGDDLAKNAALDRLKKFGPQFANWESKWDVSSESWLRAMAEAQVGLCRSFGIQFTQPPVTV